MKYLLVILTIGIISYVSGVSDSEPPTIDFRPHFQALRNKRYPFYENGEHWKDARYYVADKMRYYGARVLIEQIFNTTVDGRSVSGVNLIGLSEGDYDNNGSVIIVGADYDSAAVGNPLKNNAGGIACLLETMHLFYDKIYWNQFHLNYTVIFVAFDLNTREYHNKEHGRAGSYYFIHEWLLDYLGNDTSVRDFRGAIILDSVTTYNTVNGSQTLRGGFEKAMPEAYEEIEANERRGDFIGFLFNSKDEDNTLRNAFISEYNRNETDRPFRLQEMEINLGFNLVNEDILQMINHQSHWAFWTNVLNRHLPVYLLFDTDEDRDDPTPNACTEISCSVDEFLTDERIYFMTQTTRALFNTLMNLQTTYYDEIPEPSDSATLASSFILLAASLAFALARLLRN